ncbi:MAG: DnaA regulatory inactivator Hda [Xanthomonadales bacterium]
MLFSPQMPLQLEPPRPDRLDDFHAGPNGAVLDAVRHLLDDPGGVLFLSGPEGCGKSHLLNGLCHAAREHDMAAFYIALKRLPEAAAAGLEGLQQLDLVCVDDIDHVVGNPVWERALFRCFNEVRSAQGRLLVSSRRPLTSLAFRLPDLASRLAWGVRLKLQVPDEADKRAVLQRRARSLHIELPGEVEDYLLKHGRRDMASLLRSVERLRDAAFVGKRKITVPLAREVLRQGQAADRSGTG